MVVSDNPHGCANIENGFFSQDTEKTSNQKDQGLRRIRPKPIQYWCKDNVGVGVGVYP